MTTSIDHETPDLEGANPASLDFWERPDVLEVFQTLRQESPVTWHEHEDSGQGFWSVVRHPDVAEVNGDFRRFTSTSGARIYQDPDMGLDVPSGTEAFPWMDPPKHTSMRKLVSRAFTVNRVAHLEGMIRERTQDILSSLPTTGSFDFVAAASAPLPLHVICDLLDIPDEDRMELFELTNRNVGAQDPDVSDGREASSDAAKELRAYGMELANRRLKEPKDDLVTKLVNATVDERGLTPEEMGGFLALLVVAGNETTRNAITFGLQGFTEFPDQVDLLLKRPELVGSMADEVLRWASPLLSMRRQSTEDTVLSGVEIKRGDKVVMWYYSSNRDETVFADPGRFDISRNPNPHHAFGGGGPHYCLGSNLARLELRVFFDELFRKFPALRLTGEPVILRSNQFRGARRAQASVAPNQQGVPS